MMHFTELVLLGRWIGESDVLKAGIVVGVPPKKKARAENDDIEDEPGYDHHTATVQF